MEGFDMGSGTASGGGFEGAGEGGGVPLPHRTRHTMYKAVSRERWGKLFAGLN